MDRLAAMRAFVEIVDRGSLTAAGDALGKSLPTVVRTLASLEDSLGVVLLRRTTRRMSLTEEGRIYLDRCRRILADVDEAADLVGAGSGRVRGSLRVTAPVLFGQMHFAPLVAAFLREHPELEIDLLLLDRVVDLVEEGVDAAIRIGPLVDSSMIGVALGSMRRVVVASPALLEAVGTPAEPEALADLPCVGFSGLAPGWIWRFERDGRDCKVHVRGSFRSNAARAAIDACVSGVGFGQFLAYQVELEVEAGRLVVLLEAFERSPVPVSLVYPDARLASRRLRAFVDWMKPRLRERLGDAT